MVSREKSEHPSYEQLKSALAAARGELERRERMWQLKLEIASRVHKSLLPKPVRHPRIDIDVRYVPVETVGGDYCQVLFPSESNCYVTLCDVTGHGIGPALLATRVSSQVRHLVMQQLRPMKIVAELNSFILEHFLDTGVQVLSFFATHIDLECGVLTYCGAGHPGPFLFRRGRGTIEVLASQNILIGAVEQCLSDHPEDTQPVEPGDRLFFFTDGLTESMDAHGRMLGSDGLKQILIRTSTATGPELADRIIQCVIDFREGPAADDMTLIVAELKAP